MMGLDEFSRLVGYLHDDWAFVIWDIDIKETFGRIRVDIYNIVLNWFDWIHSTVTSLSERWVKNKRVDIGMDACDGHGPIVFYGIYFIYAVLSAEIGQHLSKSKNFRD